MGILDSLLGAASSGAAGGTGNTGAGSLLQTVEGLVQQHGGGVSGAGLMQAVEGLLQQHGGISGLAQAFQAGGLGHLVSSWVGTGQNLPVTADQLKQVLGSDKIAGLARQFNIDPDRLGGLLAKVLPQTVDQLTPQGHA